MRFPQVRKSHGLPRQRQPRTERVNRSSKSSLFRTSQLCLRSNPPLPKRSPNPRLICLLRFPLNPYFRKQPHPQPCLKQPKSRPLQQTNLHLSPWPNRNPPPRCSHPCSSPFLSRSHPCS